MASCLIALLVALQRPAAAQATEPEPASAGMDFVKGDWSLSTYGAYVRDWKGRSNPAFGAVGVGYYLYDDVCFGAEARGMYVDQRNAAGAGALAATVRQHLLKSGAWSLYIDAAVGMAQASEPVPPGGTWFNFMEDAGVGMTWRLQPDVYLMGGVRYFHISNARIEGPLRNPSINGTEAYLGVLLQF